MDSSHWVQHALSEGMLEPMPSEKLTSVMLQPGRKISQDRQILGNGLGQVRTMDWMMGLCIWAILLSTKVP